MHMLTMGVSFQEVKQFVNKQCLVNGLLPDQSETLLVFLKILTFCLFFDCLFERVIWRVWRLLSENRKLFENKF